MKYLACKEQHTEVLSRDLSSSFSQVKHLENACADRIGLS